MVPLIAPLDFLADVLGRDDFKADAMLALEVESDTGAGGRVPVHYGADSCGRRISHSTSRYGLRLPPG